MNRRQYLRACAGTLGGVAGCLTFDSEPSVGTVTCAETTHSPANDGELPSISTDWPTSQFDARNSSYNPSVTSTPDDCAQVQWKYAIPSAGQEAGGTELLGDPATHDGTVYLSTTQKGRLIALEANTGTEVWRMNLSNDSASTPTVAGELVFVGSDGSLDAVDRETGPVEWTSTLSQRYREEMFSPVGDEIRYAPKVSHDRVLVGTTGGRVRAFSASTGDSLWTEEVPRPMPTERPEGENLPSFGQIAVSHDTVYAASRNHRLYALDAASGERKWTFEADSDLESRAGTAPTIVEDTVYINSESTLYALDAIDGTVQWTYSEGSAETSPVVVEDTLYTAVGTSRKSLAVVALDLNDRSVEWRRPGRPQGSPSYGNGTLYIGMYGDLVAIDVETGEVNWRLETEGVLDDAPIVADGAVIVSDIDGYVYGIREL